jgi:hypothetical protein
MPDHPNEPTAPPEPPPPPEEERPLTDYTIYEKRDKPPPPNVETR